jgi:hypothetical protein
MKVYFIFLLSLFCLCFIKGKAQSNNLQIINDQRCNVSVQFPTYNLTHFDTLGVSMYFARTTDSLVSAQLVIYNGVTLNGNEDLISYMQEYGGTLASLNILQNSATSKLMDLGIRYTDSTTAFIGFYRISMRHNKTVILTALAQECFISELLGVKDEIYNSLVCQ